MCFFSVSFPPHLLRVWKVLQRKWRKQRRSTTLVNLQPWRLESARSRKENPLTLVKLLLKFPTTMSCVVEQFQCILKFIIQKSNWYFFFREGGRSRERLTLHTYLSNTTETYGALNALDLLSLSLHLLNNSPLLAGKGDAGEWAWQTCFHTSFLNDIWHGFGRNLATQV